MEDIALSVTIALGFLSGFKHAFEPDHVIATLVLALPFVASRRSPTFYHALTFILSVGVLLLAPTVFAADEGSPSVPGFDRPGLLFATDTTPKGHFIFEQGLPDIAYFDGTDADAMFLMFNSQLRYGLVPGWEVQTGMAPLATIRIETPDDDVSESGYSDLRLGVKHVLPESVGTALGGASVAVLGGITLPTGDDNFTADDEVIDLGVTALWNIADGRSVGALVQLTSGTQDSLLLAAAYNAPLGNEAGYYLEAGITAGDSDGNVAGGGITWLPWWNVQLDTYLLAGFSGNAPDIQAGFGVSVYFD